MLPGTSAAIFAIFPCDELDDGKRWLKNDYSVSCIDGNWSHDAFKFYGLIMILNFPIGIPISYSILLLRRRKRLNPRGAARSEIKRMLAKDRTLEEEVTLRRESDNSLQSTVFLWGSYRPHAWWFEIFECCRRLALTGALVFIRQGEKEEGGGKGGKPLRLILTLNFITRIPNSNRNWSADLHQQQLDFCVDVALRHNARQRTGDTDAGAACRDALRSNDVQNGTNVVANVRPEWNGVASHHLEQHCVSDHHRLVHVRDHRGRGTRTEESGEILVDTGELLRDGRECQLEVQRGRPAE